MILLLAFVPALLPMAYAGKGRPQEKCPVMGGPINKSYFVDYRGKRIYFCCPACPQEFMKNPDMYMEKLEKEGVELEPAPTD